MLTDIPHFLKNLPTQPGVYQMLNKAGQLIYVGKARNLKKRVSSYFHRQLDTKTQVMISQVVDIQTIVTTSENEALLLEANFIKEHRPRYNVLLRDDKSYPYLYLSTQQAFPRLDFHRGAKKQKGQYFGPYPTLGSVRENLALIQKLFKIRQCRDSFFKNRSRACLQYQIKRCTGPCVGHVTEEDYQQQVEHAILFLEGKSEAVMEEIAAKMQAASLRQAYEEAAYYRDQIAQLRRLQKKQFIVGDQGDIDVIGIASQNRYSGIVILFIRGGRLIGSKHFFPNLPPEADHETALSAFLPQYYLNPVRAQDIPERIILTEVLPDRLWIQSALREALTSKLKISDRRSTSSRSELGSTSFKHWEHLAKTNAEQALAQHVLKKDTVTHKLEALQRALDLADPIQRIECFDVSHSQGEATVASCVVFGQEGAENKAYRRFNIKGVTPGDDYAALYQALSRHYGRLKEKEASDLSQEGDESAPPVFPDVLLIDGGWGQLKQAAKALEELQINGILLLGVAKGPSRKAGLEQLCLWETQRELHLSSDDVALHLIQFIRDEAHRFAITAHRKQRDKSRVESPLEHIEGVGPKRRQQLLKHFGGWQGLKKASKQEIAEVKGISEALAARIVDALS